MSYESNDERFDKLEDQMAGLGRSLVESIHALTGLVTALRNDQVGTLRFLWSSSLITDEGERQRLLKLVSKLESAGEKMESMVESMRKSLQKFAPGSAPPDDPPAPGP